MSKNTVKDLVQQALQTESDEERGQIAQQLVDLNQPDDIAKELATNEDSNNIVAFRRVLTDIVAPDAFQ